MFVVKNELIVRDKEDTHPRAIFHGQSIRLIASMTGRAKFSSVIHNRPMVFFFFFPYDTCSLPCASQSHKDYHFTDSIQRIEWVLRIFI